eukprot:jgi/Botrbrau1/8394/Bobra.0237s0015.1
MGTQSRYQRWSRRYGWGALSRHPSRTHHRRWPQPGAIASVEKTTGSAALAANSKVSMHLLGGAAVTAVYPVARPVCHEQGVQTDEIPPAVAYADVCKWMHDGVANLDLGTLEQMAIVGRKMKHSADSKRMAHMDLLKNGDEGFFFHLMNACLESSLWFLAWIGLRDNGSVAPAEIEEQYLKIIKLIRMQITDSLQAYKQGDPHLRSLIRALADRLLGVLYTRMAFCGSQRLRTDALQLKRLPRRENKVSPDSNDSTRTSALKSGQARSSAKPPAGPPAETSQPQIIIPHNCIKAHESIVSAAENSLTGFTLLKRTSDALSVLMAEAPHLKHIIFLVQLVGIENGANMKAVFWAGDQARLAIEAACPKWTAPAAGGTEGTAEG